MAPTSMVAEYLLWARDGTCFHNRCQLGCFQPHKCNPLMGGVQEVRSPDDQKRRFSQQSRANPSLSSYPAPGALGHA